MNRMFRYILLSALCFTVAMLTGCAGGHGGGSGWGNYKCTAAAKTGGTSVVGWSTSRGSAKSNAMTKCRERSRHPSSCHIVSCVNQA